MPGSAMELPGQCRLPFKGKDAVYFQLQTDDYYWTQTLDSMVYTFAGKGVEEDTLWVQVNLQGMPSRMPVIFLS